MDAPSGFHVRDIPKAIHLTFREGYPLEGDISHYLSTKFAQRYGGRHTDFRVSRFDVLGSQYVVIVRSGDYRNQLCRTPTFDISTPTYAGPVILRPWTRASGGFIERPSHFLKVRLEGVPLHLWREDLFQYLCSSFGTVLRVGDRSSFHAVRLLIMGKHPAEVPRELMLSQDPAVKFADVMLEGWAPLFDPPQNVPPVGPQLPWIPPYQPNNVDHSDSSGIDSDGQQHQNRHGYQFGSQPTPVHREHAFFPAVLENQSSLPFASRSLMFTLDPSNRSVSIKALCADGSNIPICRLDFVGPFKSVFKTSVVSFSKSLVGPSNLSLSSIGHGYSASPAMFTPFLDFPVEDTGPDHGPTDLFLDSSDGFDSGPAVLGPIIAEGCTILACSSSPLPDPIGTEQPPGFEQAIHFSGSASIRRSPRLKTKLNGPYFNTVERASLSKYGDAFTASNPKKSKSKKKAFLSDLDPCPTTNDLLSLSKAEACLARGGVELDDGTLAKLRKAKVVPLGGCC